MIAVDTNVLIYAHREELPQHQQALAWLSALAEGSGPWGLPVFCIGEFMRVITHPYRSLAMRANADRSQAVRN